MNKKTAIHSILIFFIVTLIGSTLNFNNQTIGLDRVWLFMEAKKMTEGYLIYRDLNVILGPVFYWIFVLLMKVFGVNYFAGDIYAGLQCGTTAVLTYWLALKLNRKNNPLITLTMLLSSFFYVWLSLCANYNIMVLHFIMMVLLIEIEIIRGKDKWQYHFLIGVLIALAFFTKQTVGGIAVLCMVAFPLIHDLWIKKENPFSKIVIRLLGSFIVLLVICGHMYVKGNLINYLDLCFGSILEFGEKNGAVMPVLGFPSLMLGLFICSISMIPSMEYKSEFLAIAVYEMACLTFAIPIGNAYHFCMALYLIWFMVIPLLEIMEEKDNKQIANLLVVIMMVCQMFFIYNQPDATISGTGEVSKASASAVLYYQIAMKTLLCAWGWALVKERPIFLKTTYIFCGVFSIAVFVFTYYGGVQENSSSEGFPIYANHGFYESELKEIRKVVEYIEEKEAEGFHVLLISAEAAKYTTAMNRNQNKYDLFLSGNLGYNGTQRALEEMKQMHNTLFIKAKGVFWQEPHLIMDYVTENLPLYDELDDFNVYIKD